MYYSFRYINQEVYEEFEAQKLYQLQELFLLFFHPLEKQPIVIESIICDIKRALAANGLAHACVFHVPSVALTPCEIRSRHLVAPARRASAVAGVCLECPRRARLASYTVASAGVPRGTHARALAGIRRLVLRARGAVARGHAGLDGAVRALLAGGARRLRARAAPGRRGLRPALPVRRVHVVDVGCTCRST